jgi:hypothetical protein
MLKILSLVFLFFILTPGILWSYPKKTNKYSIALLHACVFAFVWYLIEIFSNTPMREGLAKNDKRLSFIIMQPDDKKDKEVERKIKQVHGNKIEISYTAISEKTKQKAKEKGREIKTSYHIALTKRDNKDEYEVEPITREDIMEMPNNQKINDFIKKYE